METSRGEILASYSALRGKEYWDFACGPRIRAHYLTAGPNRLDVHLRGPRKFRVSGPCRCRIQKREPSPGCAPLWWRPPESSLGTSWAQRHGRLSSASRGRQHQPEPVDDSRTPGSAESSPRLLRSGRLNPREATLKLKGLSLPLPSPSL